MGGDFVSDSYSIHGTCFADSVMQFFLGSIKWPAKKCTPQQACSMFTFKTLLAVSYLSLFTGLETKRKEGLQRDCLYICIDWTDQLIFCQSHFKSAAENFNERLRKFCMQDYCSIVIERTVKVFFSWRL